MPTTPQPWINTADYSPPLLLLFGLGCFGWVIAYYGVFRTIREKKYVQIPAAAVVANIAWEFVWGFFFINNLGRLFSWGYRIWFLMDVYITYCLFKYCNKQVENPILKKYARPLLVLGIVSWSFFIYFFVSQGYDTGYGAITGYILNVMMSAFYITLLLRQDVRNFSYLVAWSKMLGTALLSVFNIIIKGDDHFLVSLCVITFILDVLYIALFHRRLVEQRLAPAVAS